VEGAMMKSTLPFWVLGVMGDENNKPQFVKATWNQQDYVPTFTSEKDAITFAELKKHDKQLVEIPNKGKAIAFLTMLKDNGILQIGHMKMPEGYQFRLSDVEEAIQDFRALSD
jgi:hypothetical protein